MAFLRSDSDDEAPQRQQPPPPPPPLSRGGSGPGSRQGSFSLEQHGHPARSRFFDVPAGGDGGQPGTPSSGNADPSVVGRKLTFDQFKAAAAGGQPPQHHGGPGEHHHAGRVMTAAELEHRTMAGAAGPGGGGPGAGVPGAARSPPQQQHLPLHCAAAEVRF